jgi:type I restriction enzyme, S subunit
MDNWQLPIDWDWKVLPEVCELNPKRPRLQRADDVPTAFVPMQAVDDIEGKITGMETRRYEEVKRGYTYFEEKDVLMAKITPSMENGKAAIAQNLIDGIGFGTTEFHVFRPKEGILPAWIFYFIRRLSFRLEAKSHFRGAVGQQRVPQEFLKSYEIPVPFPNDAARSLETQKRIVLRLETLLGEVTSARQLHESIEEDTSQVVERVLLEVFGSPHPEWGNNIIRDVTIGKPQYGLSAALSEEPVGMPVLRMGNIQNGKITLDKLKYVELSQSEIRKYMLTAT